MPADATFQKMISTNDFQLHVQTFYEETIVFDKWINGTTQVGKSDKYSLSVSPNGAAILTKVAPTSPVGGERLPVDKLQLLAPWITMASLIVAVSVSFVYAKHKKNQQN
jgi:hypothetical protein